MTGPLLSSPLCHHALTTEPRSWFRRRKECRGVCVGGWMFHCLGAAQGRGQFINLDTHSDRQTKRLTGGQPDRQIGRKEYTHPPPPSTLANQTLILLTTNAFLAANGAGDPASHKSFRSPWVVAPCQEFLVQPEALFATRRFLAVFVYFCQSCHDIFQHLSRHFTLH